MPSLEASGVNHLEPANTRCGQRIYQRNERPDIASGNSDHKEDIPLSTCCEAGHIGIGKDCNIDRRLLQANIKTYDVSLLKTDRSPSLLPGGWSLKAPPRRNFNLDARIVFGRLLLKVIATKTLRGLYEPNAVRPRKIAPEELDGVPYCHCEGEGISKAHSLQTVTRCALSYQSYLPLSWRRWIIDKQLAEVQICTRCGILNRCIYCSTKCKIRLQRLDELASDGYLIIKRMRDAGLVNSIVRPEQSSIHPHPVYAILGTSNCTPAG